LRSFSRPLEWLRDQLFEKSVIIQFKAILTWLHLLFQGEAFLKSTISGNWYAMADQQGIFHFASTNASLWRKSQWERSTRSGLKPAIVSMDGISAGSL